MVDYTEFDWDEMFPEPETEADFATLRLLGRITVGRTFALQFGRASDRGSPARTVWQVVSEDADTAHFIGGEDEAVTLHESPAGRIQVKARVVRDRGRVVELRFERVTGRANRDAELVNLVTLDEAATARLMDLCQALRAVDPTGEQTLKVDEDFLAAILADPNSAQEVYNRDPERFKSLIESDVSATDVIAIAARRSALERFETLLNDPAEFESARQGGKRESVWQLFFEENPWVLGVGLSGHLFTAYDPKKLERTVAGSSIADKGKRVDALLTTSGVVRSLVFAEFKLHDDPLLHEEFRPGCWSPSAQLTSGIAQAHTTIDRARDDLGAWLSPRDEQGFPTGESIFTGMPRSFLIIGRLGSLTRDGRPHPDMVRSLELFRGHLHTPEVLTYDEVLARARWALELIEQHGVSEEPVHGAPD